MGDNSSSKTTARQPPNPQINPESVTIQRTRLGARAVALTSMAEEGLSEGIVIAIAVISFFILIVGVLFILLCACKGKISWLNFDKVSDDEMTHSSRFGEGKIDFVTKRLNKIRLQRGAQPIYDQPLRYHEHHRGRYHHHEMSSNYEGYADEMTPRYSKYPEALPSQYYRSPRDNESYTPSVHLRRYEESLTDGYTMKRGTKLKPLDMEAVPKRKSKKKKRTGAGSLKPLKQRKSRRSETSQPPDVPRNEMPDNSTLKEAGFSKDTSKEKAKTPIPSDPHPNAFSDSEASDHDFLETRKTGGTSEV